MQLDKPVRKHPNASLGGTGGSAGVALVWVLSLFQVQMNTVQAATVATVCATGVLIVGRHGFKGIWRMLCNGVGEEA